MPLVTLNEVLPEARAAKRAVCAFNVVNTESTAAVIAAAELERQPVIVQVYHRLFTTQKAGCMAALVRHMAAHARIPVVLHLDHGQALEQIAMAVEYGFTSVMFDGSRLPFSENIEATRKAVRIAHRAGLAIEGEIGSIPAADSESVCLSTPEEAIAFSQRTGVDALAVAVGTAHGFYKREPVIDLELAERISQTVPIPLVLHGGSGTPLPTIRTLIRTGFAKLNIATELHAAFLDAVQRESAKRQGAFLAIDLFMEPVTETLTELARKRIRLCAGTDA